MGISYGTENDIRSKRKNINFQECDLSYLLNQTNSRICLWDYSGEVVIDGILNGDIAFSGNNSFSSSSSTVSEGSVVDKINKGYDTIKGVASAFNLFGVGEGMASRQFRSPLQTVVDWKGSGEFTLALQIVFVSLTADYDVRDDIFKVMRGVYPTLGAANATIVAPMGYTKLSNKTILPTGSIFSTEDINWDKYKESGIPGCWGIAIGDWFEAEPIFVMETANITASKEQNIYGSPLYASGSIAVKCSQAVSRSMVGKWLKRENINLDDAELLG